MRLIKSKRRPSCGVAVSRGQREALCASDQQYPHASAFYRGTQGSVTRRRWRSDGCDRSQRSDRPRWTTRAAGPTGAQGVTGHKGDTGGTGATGAGSMKVLSARVARGALGGRWVRSVAVNARQRGRCLLKGGVSLLGLPAVRSVRQTPLNQ